MRKTAVICITLFIGFTSLLSAAKTMTLWTILSQNVAPGSVANVAQLEQIYRVVEVELTNKHSNLESMIIMNRKLKELQLPEINVNSPELKVKLTLLIGFDDSKPIGVEIKDGAYDFCLPCSIGHNDFKMGITPATPK